MKKKLSKFSCLIIGVAMLTLNILLLKFTHNLNVLPNKYYLVIFGTMIILEIVSVLSIINKRKIINAIGYILSIFLIAINIFGIYYVKITDNFLTNSFNNDKLEYTTTFYIISKKDTNNETNIINSNIGYYIDTPNIDQAIKEFNNTLKNTFIKHDNINGMFNNLSKSIDYILIEKNLYNYTFEIDKTLNKDNYNIVYEYTLTFKEEIIESINNNTNNSNYIPETNNINIYIGGTDFTNQLYDFNMIVSINKDTHKILLTSIPRDYHIPVYGKGGRTDNIGYHGALGITTSMKSLEQLLNIKINYYVRVKTNSLVGVVNALDGITFCSDKSFYTTHATILDSYDDTKGDKLYVEKGCHNYNGIEILTISRERLAYSSGDRQRQKNCQSILISIFNKATSPGIIKNYQNLLNSISDLYTTNIPRDTITDYIKDILDNGTNWTFNTQSLDGYDGSGYVHLTNYKDYIMIPYQSSINSASYNIKHN